MKQIYIWKQEIACLDMFFVPSFAKPFCRSVLESESLKLVWLRDVLKSYIHLRPREKKKPQL